MDKGKCKALVEWINSIGVGECIESLRQLKDGTHFLKLLQLIDGEQQNVTHIEDDLQRFHIIKTHIESSYHTSVENLINFQLINSAGSEVDIGKVALLLLAGGISCENNIVFIEPATKLDNFCQLEIKEMIEALICQENKPLDTDFASILKKPLGSLSPSSSKLAGTPKSHTPSSNSMAEVSSQHQRKTPVLSGTPHNVAQQGSILRRFTSPQLFTVKQQESPMPMSPVQALVQSPQMASKISLQQRDQRIKRLERDLNSERHLRSELENDMREKELLIQEKDSLLREAQQQLGVMQRLQDDVDVSNYLREEVEKKDRDITRLKKRLHEVEELRVQVENLEKENKELYSERFNLKEQMKSFENLRKDWEELRTQSKQQDLQLSQLLEQLQMQQQKLEETSVDRQSAQNQVQQLKELLQEKTAELEERLRQSACQSGALGESMHVVTHVQDLEAQLGQLTEQYQEMSQNKENVEARFLEAQREMVQLQDQTRQLQDSMESGKKELQQLNAAKLTALQQAKAAEVTITTLHEREKQLMTSIGNLENENQKQEEEKKAVTKQLHKMQSELQLTKREMESQLMAHESRRQTLSHSISEISLEKNNLVSRLEEQQVAYASQIKQLESEIKDAKQRASTVEEELRGKLQAANSNLRQLQIKTENELWTKDNIITSMKEEFHEMRKEAQERHNQIHEDLSECREAKKRVEGSLSKERAEHHKQLSEGRKIFEDFQTEAQEKQQKLMEEFEAVTADAETYKLELQRLKLNSTNREQELTRKVSGLESKLLERKQQTQQLDEQLKVVQGQTELLQDQIQTLQINYDGKVSESWSLDKQLKEAYGISDRLKQELRGYRMSASEKDAEYQTQICTLNGELEQLRQCVHKKTAELTESEHKHQHQRALIERQYDEMKLRCEEKNKHIGELKIKMESLETKLTCTKASEDELREKLAEAEEQSTRELASMKQIRIAETDVLNKKLAEVTEKEDELTKKLAQSAQRELELSQTVTGLELQLNETQSQAETMEEELRMQVTALEHKYTSDMGELQTRNAHKIKQLEGEIDDMRNTEEEIRHKAEAEVQEMKTSHEAELSKLKAESETGQVNMNTQYATESQQREAAHQAELQQLQMRHEEQLKQQQQEELQKAQLQQEQLSAAHREELARLTKEGSTAAALVLELEAQIRDLSSKHGNILSDIKTKNDEELRRLKEQCRKSEESMRWYKREIGKMEIEMDRMSVEEQTRNDQIQDYKQKVVALQDKTQHQEQQLNHVKLELQQRYANEAASMQADHQSRITQLQKELEQAHSDGDRRTEDFSNQMTELHDRYHEEITDMQSKSKQAITQLQAALAETHEKANQHEKHAAEVHQKAMEELKSDNRSLIEKLKTESELKIRGVQTELAEAQQKYETELVSLRGNSQSKIQQLEAEIEATKQRAAETEGHLQELGRLKGNYESKVSLLTESVKKLSVQLSQTCLERDNKEQQLQTERVQNEEHSKSLIGEIETIKSEAEAKQAHLQSSLDLAHSEIHSWKLKVDETEQQKRHLEASLREKQETLVMCQAEAQNVAEQLRTEKKVLEQHVQHACQQHEETKSNLSAKLQSQIESMEASKGKMSQHVKELEGTLQTYMEREKRLIVDHQKNMKMASEMNQKLRYQLSDKQQELRQHSVQMDELKSVAEQQKVVEKEHGKLLEEVESLQQKLKCQNKSSSQLQVQLTESESKRQDLHDRYRDHYEKRLEQLTTRLTEVDTLATQYQQQCQRLEAEVAPLKTRIKEDEGIKKKLGQQVHSLEAQIEHANRQLHNRRVSSAAELTLHNRRTSSAAELRNTKKQPVFSASEASDTLDDSLDKEESSAEESYSRRSRVNKSSPQNMEVTQGLQTPLLRSRKSFSISSSVTPLSKPDAEISFLNTTTNGGIQTRAKSRHSTSNLVGAMHFEPSVSTTIIPCGAGALFSCEDEPMQEFEWGRLSELQRRNTMCLPHLKTSYPVETQVRKLKETSDDELKFGKQEEQPRYHTRSFSRDSLDENLTASARRKSRPLSNRVGPSTPSSPGGAGIKFYPRYSPQKSPRKKTPKRGKAPKAKTPSSARRKRFSGIATPAKKLKQSIENTFGHGRNLDQSVAFDIGFTPKKMKKLLSSKKKDAKAMQPPRVPLKSRNDLVAKK